MCPDGELTLTLPAYLVQSTCEASQLVDKAQGNLSIKLSVPPPFFLLRQWLVMLLLFQRIWI